MGSGVEDEPTLQELVAESAKGKGVTLAEIVRAYRKNNDESESCASTKHTPLPLTALNARQRAWRRSMRIKHGLRPDEDNL